MARKESITIRDILDTTFELAREAGAGSVTARNVAAKAGCSTQPIFRVFRNMEDLCQAVYGKAIRFFEDHSVFKYRDGVYFFRQRGKEPF